jgi:hypothetical protein
VATSGRARALALVAGLAAVVAACTSNGSGRSNSGSTSSTPSTSATPSAAARPTGPPAAGGVAFTAAPCYVSLPAAWQAALHRGLLWRNVADAHPSGPPAPQGTGVLFQSDQGTTSHIGFVGRDHRVVENIGTVANPQHEGQLGFSSVTDSYAAFVYHPVNGDAASWRWQLYLWDRTARTLQLVARNPVDKSGNPLHSGFVQPVLTSDYLYWIQAASDTTGWGGSALMQYGLATHRTRMLYRGLTESFVPYGSTVLFTGIVAHPPKRTPADTNGPPERMYAVEQATGRPVPAPPGITAAADHPNTMVTNGDLVVWATDLVIRAWRPGWGKSITLVPSGSEWPEGAKLGISGPVYPRLYKHFLVWNSGATFVLDLLTDTFAQLDPADHAGGEDLSGSILALQPSTNVSSNTAAPTHAFDQYLINLVGLPGLPRCGA